MRTRAVPPGKPVTTWAHAAPGLQSSWAIANASYKQQKLNAGVTEIVKLAGRGHALTIDSGWREVADTALAFIQRFH
jgi:hypothetical protein